MLLPAFGFCQSIDISCMHDQKCGHRSFKCASMYRFATSWVSMYGCPMLNLSANAVIDIYACCNSKELICFMQVFKTWQSSACNEDSKFCNCNCCVPRACGPVQQTQRKIRQCAHLLMESATTSTRASLPQQPQTEYGDDQA